MKTIYSILIGLLLLSITVNAKNNKAKHTKEWEKLSVENQQFLDQIQRKAFDYFWEGFDPVTGLIRDKHKGDRTSIAHSGFGLSAFCIGVDRGWVTKEEAYKRILITLKQLLVKILTIPMIFVWRDTTDSFTILLA